MRLQRVTSLPERPTAQTAPLPDELSVDSALERIQAQVVRSHMPTRQLETIAELLRPLKPSFRAKVINVAEGIGPCNIWDVKNVIRPLIE